MCVRRVKRATIRQLGLIEDLRLLLRFADDVTWSRWLAERFNVGSAGEIQDWGTAQKVIGALARLKHQRDYGAADRHLRAVGRDFRRVR